MAVQQRRVSKSRKGMRRAHDHLDIQTTTTCRNCGNSIKPHRVCSECGYYKNRQVIAK